MSMKGFTMKQFTLVASNERRYLTNITEEEAVRIIEALGPTDPISLKLIATVVPHLFFSND
jgi:hypothetical protein